MKKRQHDLRTSWARLGVAFDERIPRKGSVDLERLMMDTCIEGRKDPRLLFGMIGWLLKHHDLVNVNRLIRMVKETKPTAILGAVIDAVLEHVPRSSLKYVRKYCKRLRKPEYVFEEIERSKVMRRLNEEENLPLWKTWSLISREMDVMEGGIAEKAFVLSRNGNLALRALFGTGIRAEILQYLVEHGEGNAHQIAHEVGQSYEPVYSELKICEDVGLLEPVTCGRATIYRLRPEFLQKALKPLLAA
jgi:hypothetical protein